MREKKLSEYQNPALAVDVVLVSVINGETNILLRQRNEERLTGAWALPGGMVSFNEDLNQKAAQVLKDKAGIKQDIYVEQLHTFGALDRDKTQPGVRVVSVAYLGIVDPSKITLESSDKSSNVWWVPLSKLPKLAFDHLEIINKALERVKNKLRYSNVGFYLVPEEFTVPELRENFEVLLGEKLNPTNFRTKLLKLGVLDELNKKKSVKKKGQPAPLYKINFKKLAKLKNTETLFN